MTCWYIAEMWKAENFILKPLQNVPAALCPEITHGHYYGVSIAFDQLAEAARSRGCNAAFFGHIHVPVVEKEAGVLLVNPGSLAFPRQRGRRPSYAVMETEGKGEMHVEIRYL